MTTLASVPHERSMQTPLDAHQWSPTSLADELDRLADVLREVGEACDRAARGIAPSDPLAQSLCARYRAAATRWPGSPSYERIAAVLAGLHKAGASAHVAARQCDDAQREIRKALP